MKTVNKIIENTIKKAVRGYFKSTAKDMLDKTIKIGKEKIKNEFSITLKFRELDNDIYLNINKWLFENLNSRTIKRNLQLLSNDNKKINNGFYFGVYKKTFITVEISDLNSNILDSGYRGFEIANNGTLTLSIYGKGEDCEEVKKEIELYINPIFEIPYKTCDTKVISSSNTYTLRSPARKDDTIYGKAVHEVMDYIQQWETKGDELNSKGIIHKTGILLYGPKGTGKTSIRRAIANKYSSGTITEIKLDTYIKYPEKLIGDLISKIPGTSNTSVVCFEEIDSIMPDESDSSSIKNAKSIIINTLKDYLDGTLICNGTIVIATTNELDKIHRDLRRKGRFDKEILVDNFSKEEAIEFCKYWGKEPSVYLKDVEYPINPSSLQHKLLYGSDIDE